VLRLILGQGLRLTAVGLAAGLAGAVALSRLMQTVLYDVRPTDAATYAAVTVVLLVAALAASVLPAWRAARVDPVTALRIE
jgi:putative ABC transport system permease protein